MSLECNISQLLNATTGEQLADIFLEWRDQSVSVTSLVKASIAHFDISDENLYLKGVFNIAAAADVPVNNSYHNNHHFREVTAAMVRLIDIHNKNFLPKLNDNDICKCLIAAAGHDLGHLGRGNNKPYEQEEIAISQIEKIASLNDEDFEKISVMVKMTDLAHSQEVQNSLLMMEDEKLKVMAAILCDADITPSTATTYSFNIKMSTLLSQETGTVEPTAKNLLNFIQYALGAGYKSAAANLISAPALNLVKAEASKHLSI